MILKEEFSISDHTTHRVLIAPRVTTREIPELLLRSRAQQRKTILLTPADRLAPRRQAAASYAATEYEQRLPRAS